MQMNVLYFIRIILLLVSLVLLDVQNTFTFHTSLTDLRKNIYKFLSEVR